MQLRFSNNSFTPEAAEVAAQAIQRNSSTLTHAYMSDIIAGRPEKARPQTPKTLKPQTLHPNSTSRTVAVRSQWDAAL